MASRGLAAGSGDLLGQRVGHRLGDERLAAAGRAVEQHALRRAQLVLAEQVGVQERQLDGVADLLDLPGQATDVARTRRPAPPPAPGPRPRPSAPARRRSRPCESTSRESPASAASPSAVRRARRPAPRRRARRPGRAIGVRRLGEHLAQRARPRRCARSRRASTTVSASFSRTDWPRRSVAARPRAKPPPASGGRR